MFLQFVKVCSHGDIKLAGSNAIMEGRVEVCLNGLWGTVCDDLWTQVDANVACRQLGYSNLGLWSFFASATIIIYCHTNILFHLNLDATAFSNAYFGQGIIPIVLDNVGCSGSESQLIHCPYDPGTSDCSHSDDAGVRCQAGQTRIYSPNTFSCK